MEELKKMAAHFGFEYAEEQELMKKNPLLGLTVACVYSDGFLYGFSCDVTWDELKNEIGKVAKEYVDKDFEDLNEKDPLLSVGFMIAYTSGIRKGIAERDKVGLERDENGNIIGISTKNN